MKRLSSYEVSPRLTFMVIGGLVLAILLYTVFRIGEIKGQDRSSSDLSAPSPPPGPLALNQRPEFNTIDPAYSKVDVQSLISISSSDDAEKKRQQLIRFIWGDAGFSRRKMPEQIEHNIDDDRFTNLQSKSLKRVDHILVSMDFQLESHIYQFFPRRPSQETLVIFHQGHKREIMDDAKLIGRLLEEGYSVAAICMPLHCENNRPTVSLPNLGDLSLQTHEHMKLLVPESGHPVQFFLQPVIEYTNYAMKTFDPPHIAMVGISGGGWTTTLVAAVDPRIDVSIPVAGSYPIFLRSSSPRDWGDYEQTIPELYRTSNYLELYILGAYGEGRKQVQIINRYDNCCFAGIKWQTYYSEVTARVEALGQGEWDLFMDESHARHIISPLTQSKIVSILSSL